MAPVPKGFVRFHSSPEVSVTVRISTPAATISGGYGGWEGIRRPRENSLVEWIGHDPMQLDVPILFDGMLPDLGGQIEQEPWGDSVEHDIRILEHLTHKLDGYNSPPRIKVESDLIPYQDREWVINDIKWHGDDVRRPNDGQRVRAGAIVQLFEFIEFDIINGRLSAAARRKRAKAKNNVKTRQKKGTYIVKEGDTLRGIAKKELGSASKWHEIANANHIRDGKALRHGQHLKMP